MYHLIETIKTENKKLCNLSYHNERMNNARRKLFGCKNYIYLNQAIKIPDNISNSIFKCRVIYSDIIRKIEFTPYKFSKISSIKIVVDNEIDYSFKYENRERIDRLLETKEDCDEILIIRNGFITDTSIHNVIFFDSDKWFTPSTALLKGTTITRLLKENKISDKIIRMDDLIRFQKVMLVNAMNDFGSCVLEMDKIFS